MTKERLESIKEEMVKNPLAFEKDGYVYFKEFLPLIEKTINLEAIKQAAEKAKPVHVEVPLEVVEKKIEKKVEKKEEKKEEPKVVKKSKWR